MSFFLRYLYFFGGFSRGRLPWAYEEVAGEGRKLEKVVQCHFHTQSDESGSQLNGEAWGKGVQLSRVPLGAVLYLVLKSGRPHPRWARIPGLRLGSSRSPFYLAVLPTSALAHLARSQAEGGAYGSPTPGDCGWGLPLLHRPPLAHCASPAVWLEPAPSPAPASTPAPISAPASHPVPALRPPGCILPPRSCPAPAPAPGLNSRNLKPWLVPSLVCCPLARGSGSSLWLELGL